MSGPLNAPNEQTRHAVEELLVDALALQVLPPQAEYVNINPTVLHLWVCLDGPRPVPDFRRKDGQI